MIVPKQGFKRSYAFGGTGIFENIVNAVSGIVTSNAAKELANTAFDVGKDVAKRTATDAGTKLVKKVLTPKSKNIINKYTSTPEAEAIKINELVKRLNEGMGIKKT